MISTRRHLEALREADQRAIAAALAAVENQSERDRQERVARDAVSNEWRATVADAIASGHGGDDQKASTRTLVFALIGVAIGLGTLIVGAVAIVVTVLLATR